MIGPRLQPEHLQVLYLQLPYTLVSQGINLAPLYCVLRLFNFAHPLCYLLIGSVARVAERHVAASDDFHGRSLSLEMQARRGVLTVNWCHERGDSRCA